MKSSFKVNSSFYKKVKGLEVEVLGGVKERLEDIAVYTTSISPVKTGAYVTSFSYTVGAGRPRGKSSDNRQNSDRETEITEGLSNLMSDISKIKSIDDLDIIQLRNGSPHAVDVENKHNVFLRTKDRYR